MATKWRVLVVEDKEMIAGQIKEAVEGAAWAGEGDEVVVETCNRFAEAFEMLERYRFDIVILDLKDDNMALDDEEHEKLPGLDIFENIRQRRFLPVVFYTALPEKVRERISPFVRVVEKTQGIVGIRSELKAILKTNLPALIKHLEDEQRDYMWEFIDKHWKSFDKTHEHIDITYLLARRLAFSLRGPMVRKFAAQLDGGAVPAEEHDVHPMEMYVVPPVDGVRLAGDILMINREEKVIKDGVETKKLKDTWHIILTPSCDFEQCKVDGVLLARCFPLAEQSEFLKWSKTIPASTTSTKEMAALITDNRGGQRDRFKFLPGTFFIPDLVIDLQQLESIETKELGKFTAIASLDSPYAESLLARFARYYGRLGTPDLDEKIVIARLEAGLPKSPPTAAPKDAKPSPQLAPNASAPSEPATPPQRATNPPAVENQAEVKPAPPMAPLAE